MTVTKAFFYAKNKRILWTGYYEIDLVKNQFIS